MRSVFILITLFCALHSFAQNQNISNGSYFDGEPYIAMDPTNPQHLVAAWMGFQVGQKLTIKTSYSNNGGITWSAPIWQPHQVSGNSSADVSLGYDLNGNLYMCYIDYDNVGFTNGGVFVRKSTNGGLSWGAATEVISINDCPNKLCVDRPWMVVDKSGGINDGTVYVTSMNADQPTMVVAPYNPYLTISSDNGSTFTTPRLLDTLNYYAGSIITQPMPSPAIGADGIFYAIYPSYETTQSVFAHIYLAQSNNAGLDVDHSDVYSGTGGATDPYVKKGALLKCDPSNANHLAYFYLSEMNGDADIYFIETTDGGVNWSAQQRINQDPVSNGKLQDLVWADFDQDGDLAVCWRDRRNAAGNTYAQPTEIYCAVRWKDSLDFSADFPISDTQAAHDAVLEGSGNDFMSIVFMADTIYAVWGDVRTGILSIYLNKVGVHSGTNSISLISQEMASNTVIYPNPASEKILLNTDFESDHYVVTTTDGKVIISGRKFPKNGLKIDHLENGTYLLHLEKDEWVLTSTFVKN